MKTKKPILIIILICIVAFNFAAQPPIYASPFTGQVLPQNVEMLHWDEISQIIPLFTSFQIFDIGTGIVYNAASLSNGNHADVEPVTPLDTFLLFESFGGEQTWEARPVWVIVGERAFAAAIHSMPHDIYTIEDNGMDGHICLHFFVSTNHIRNEAVYHDTIVEAQLAFEMLRGNIDLEITTPSIAEPQLINEPEPAKYAELVEPAELIPVQGVPSAHNVRVNGQLVVFSAFNIDGNNFFRLRDVAFTINGTRSQFDVAWDSQSAAINLLPGQGYAPIGTEMAAGDGHVAVAFPSADVINVDGQRAQLRAYNIDGYNYFMLRDLSTVLGFVVEWDDVGRTVLINTQ